MHVLSPSIFSRTFCSTVLYRTIRCVLLRCALACCTCRWPVLLPGLCWCRLPPAEPADLLLLLLPAPPRSTTQDVPQGEEEAAGEASLCLTKSCQIHASAVLTCLHGLHGSQKRAYGRKQLAQGALHVDITAHKQVCHPSAWMAHLLVCCNVNTACLYPS
jgi:hypothetical protein